MTREEFCKNIDKMSNDIYVKLLNCEYHITYTPKQYEDERWGYDELLITDCEILEAYDKEHENDTEEYDWFATYSRFKTLEELLDGFLIDGVPLGQLLDKIDDMWCTVYA